jgi:sodium ion-translocating decarboxylase beta subunit
MGAIFTNIAEIFANSGWAQIFFAEGGWKYAVMIGVACVLLYLAIVHQFEPLLLLPIGFGMLMTNLPLDGIFHMDIFINETQHINWELLGTSGGMADYIYLGVKLGIYPPLIFLGIGTMTDFEPLIARPSSLLLGAAAQLGIFFTFVGAKILGFTNQEAASIGIIGGADGPTAIFVTTRLAPHLLGSIAVAAYCYMALVPVIQPPIMKALTTEKERQIVMESPRKVSKTEKILFPIIVTIIVSLTLPDAAILVGCLMLGNLMKECGVVERIKKTAGNELMNIITIFLGFSVGCTTNAATFLNIQTVEIIVLGIVAFGVGTAGGVLLGKVMCVVTHGKINPLIGSAGVSAVPMAARVSQKVGQEYNPRNYLLMHAMGPNVAGVIGSAVAAGILINMFG